MTILIKHETQEDKFAVETNPLKQTPEKKTPLKKHTLTIPLLSDKKKDFVFFEEVNWNDTFSNEKAKPKTIIL